ncbi:MULTISPECIES: hypothetical protein [Methylobacillus]|uniref:Uncharacterized protein n=1 Tax=Methylobacillus flagellatus (strain ATCC 51484 / DSM 6875 / VKM B-1610 / KT) TaxID=265072 RepID=Q1GZ71_METFK|nr:MULTISPECIES: hypothetical protein [Methylobacillus]ABE50466.1 hypothetical protein Mfla_2199 [Methylobacillus flagellatus KT]MPS49911.1 hypothetical protein [Methylobacillus sp.]
MKQKIIGFIGLLMACCPAAAVEVGPDAVNDEDIELRQLADRIPSNCRVAATRDANGQPVFFWQHTFSDGTRDLVMAASLEGRLQGIRRVTYDGSRSLGCHFPLLAIVRGGRWGWHLVWMRMNKGVYYARMDGSAWVSTPPKRMTTDDVSHIELVSNNNQVRLSWLEIRSDGSTSLHRLVSEDDGRSWERR